MSDRRGAMRSKLVEVASQFKIKSRHAVLSQISDLAWASEC